MNESPIAYPTAQELYDFAKSSGIRLCYQVSIQFSRLPFEGKVRPVSRACPSALLAIKIFGDRRYRGLFSGSVFRIYDHLEIDAKFPASWPRELDQGYLVDPQDWAMRRVVTRERLNPDAFQLGIDLRRLVFTEQETRRRNAYHEFRTRDIEE